MWSPSYILFLISLILACIHAKYNYRPQFHYSVAKGFLNDPNGLIYHKGEYHLYYQYYAGGPDFDEAYERLKTYPPINWGHAVSKDLINWKELGIAIAPDEKGIIFSGATIVDHANKAGFKKPGSANDVFIALFTHYTVKKNEDPNPNEKNQMQSLAYSLDNGRKFIKYDKNPVMPNTFKEKQFRDPTVFPYLGYWISIIATGDSLRFYKSTNMKNWEFLSKFGGKGVGSHGGVWECPSMFPMVYEGRQLWVLLVSIDHQEGWGGGPNKGTATQYFIGTFDGRTFTRIETETLWYDWGPDNYASIAFNGMTNGKVITIGWLSNWIYATELPTAAEKWRGQVTFPRELTLVKANGKPRLANKPVAAINKLNKGVLKTITNLKLAGGQNHVVELGGSPKNPPLLHVKAVFSTTTHARICFSNKAKQEACVGYEKEENQIILDRSRSGSFKFKKVNPIFYRKSSAKRILHDPTIHMDIYLDASSIEVFADGGLTTMTSLVFPDNPFTKLEVRQLNFPGKQNALSITELQITSLVHPLGGAGAPAAKTKSKPTAAGCTQPGAKPGKTGGGGFFSKLCSRTG